MAEIPNTRYPSEVHSPRHPAMRTPRLRGDDTALDSSAVTVAPTQPAARDSALKETMRLYLEELKGATEAWAEQKGGVARMGGANRTLLRTLKLVVHGMDMAVKLGGENEESARALRRYVDDAVGREMDSRMDDWRYQAEDSLAEQTRTQIDTAVCVAIYESGFMEELITSLRDRMRYEDVEDEAQTREVRDFVLAQIKAQRDAPETAQDRQTECGMPID